jgi:DNA-binding IclR family transcriptional regulator
MNPDKLSDNAAKAPALEGGLTILDMLVRMPDGLSFTDIEQALPQSKATVVRLLKIMVQRGYVLRHALRGRYYPGPKLLNSALIDVKPRIWAKHAEPLLEQITAQTANTSILFHWNGFGMQSLVKRLHPESIAMQELGNIDTSFVDSPWGWIVIATFFSSLSYKELSRRSRFGLEFKPGRLDFYREHGFAFDDRIVYPSFRRLAVPVLTPDGTFVGILGVGGTVQSISDKNLANYVDVMHHGALKLGKLWSATGTVHEF